MITHRYTVDRHGIARAQKYIDRFNEAVKAAGGIVQYMAGQTFHKPKPQEMEITDTQNNKAMKGT